MIPLGVIGAAHVAAAAAGGSYYDEVMADGPYLYFPLDDVSTPTDATGTVTASLVTGMLGGSGIGDGATSYEGVGGTGYGGGIQVTNAQMPSGMTAFTIEALAIEADNAQTRPVFSWEGLALMRVDTGANLRCFTGGSWANQIGSNVGITSTVVHHYAMTWDGATARLFLDGTQIQSEANSAGSMSGTGNFMMGGRNSTTDRDWDGLIAGVAVYESDIGAARLLAHAEAAGVA